MSLLAGPHVLERVVLISDAVVIALVVFFVLFALAVVAAAIWYNLRQEKQVRTDRDEEEDFLPRPGEEDEVGDAGDERGSGDEGGRGDEGPETGTERFRRA